MKNNTGHQSQFTDSKGPSEWPVIFTVENATINRDRVIVEGRIKDNKECVNHVNDQKDQNSDTGYPVQQP
jgi:hypothetical protein